MGRIPNPKNCKSSRRTGESRMVIYVGDLGGEENQAKVEVTVDHEAQGREHLAMVLQKFDWTKFLAVAIPAEVNGKPVVAIVDPGSAGVIISESCFEILG